MKIHPLYYPVFTLFLLFVSPSTACAASAQEIELRADEIVEIFNHRIAGRSEFLENAKGVLIFPNIVKAGVILGGEYGEGVLRIGRKTVDYYRTTGASFGFQFGA